MATFWDNRISDGATGLSPLPTRVEIGTAEPRVTTLISADVPEVAPATPVLPSETTINQNLFYDDYYERIWVEPTLFRLANPRLNAPIDFFIWNAYSVDNDLTAAIKTDLIGVNFDGSLPRAFEAYEFKPVSFRITGAAPATLNGSFLFDFEFGAAPLQIIAVLTELVGVTPEIPVNEVWAWNTVVNASHNGREQRIALRTTPRIKISYNILIENEAVRRSLYDQLYTFLTRDIQIPLHAYAVPLAVACLPNDPKLFLDVTQTNMQIGYAAVFNNQTETFKLVQIASVDADGITLVAPIDTAFRAGSLVVPAMAARIPNLTGLQMRTVAGKLALRAESTLPRGFLRPGQATGLPELDGLPILTKRPLANNEVDDTFTAAFEVLDNGMTQQATYTAWDHTQIAGTREFLMQRPGDMDFWRAFADRIRGRQNPFLVPTFREDLTLAEPAILGSTILRVDQGNYGGKWLNETYKRLQIETANGTIYRGVTAVNDVDGTLVDVVLSTALGSDPGDEDIRTISFLNLARLDTDEITLEHFGLETYISLTFQTVDV